LGSADLPTMLYHIEMKLANIGWWHLIFQNFVSFPNRNFGVNQAKAPGNSKDMGIYW
jgi:hypothetical protein